jgi:hypothetical protein
LDMKYVLILGTSFVALALSNRFAK